MTTLYAVLREPGPAWRRDRPMEEQDAWPAHAAFMNVLAETGFVALGGPLGDGSRFLLAIDAESRDEVERRLAEDPWTDMQMLTLVSVEPWEILLDRTAAVQPRTRP